MDKEILPEEEQEKQRSGCQKGWEKKERYKMHAMQL